MLETKSMKHNHLIYIILAHKEPKQVLQLVKQLYHEDDYFFIHIDKKVKITPFKEIFRDKNLNAIFVKKRENGRWGDIGLVKATLNALFEIKQKEIDYTHVSLLSGQDYPVKSTKYIREFFFRNQGKSFIEYTPFPVKHLTYGGMHRIYSYSFNFLGKRETFIPFKWNPRLSYKGMILNFFLGIYSLFLQKRIKLNNWKHYYGSQWWSLTKYVINCLLDQISKQPEIIKFYEYSLIPDEMFFQTVILNTCNNKIENNNLRFIKMLDEKSHPEFLTEKNMAEILESNSLFARKFEDTGFLKKYLK